MEFDLLVRNGLVVDGSGSPARRADIGVVGDRIVHVDQLEAATAEREVDASGKVVAPGFIDVHVHSEAQLATPLDKVRFGSVLQGVTTHLSAPDGFGWAQLDRKGAQQMWESTLFANGPAELSLDWASPEEYLSIFPGNTPVNIVTQVPHCSVRYAAMGWAGRPASDDELEHMKKLSRQWYEAGAVALCLGLDYQPSAFADTRELIELSKVAREYDAVYSAHVRYNDLGRVEAWRETMEIGEQAGVPVHISHEHVTAATKPLLLEAADRCDLSFESYLYHAGCTHLALILPIWAQQGGPEGILARLKDADSRRQIQESLQQKLESTIHESRPVFIQTQTGNYVGESIYEAAENAGVPVGEFAIRVLEEEHPYALMIYHQNSAADVVEQSIRDTIQHEAMMVASDGMYHGDFAHPRGFGTFARVLRLCVREMHAVSLESAIYKMSGFPAERFRIKDRGLLREGYGADIVIFDADTVADRATWEEPRLEPVGIDEVIVNGQTVVQDGQATGSLPGRVLR